MDSQLAQTAPDAGAFAPRDGGGAGQGGPASAGPGGELAVARKEARALANVRSLERRRLQCYLVLMLGDIFALALGFGVAGYVYLGEFAGSQPMTQMQIMLPIFLSIGLYNGSYSLIALERPVASILRPVAALIVAAAVVTFVAFYTKSGSAFSRVVLALGLAGSALAVAFIRDFLRHFIVWRCGPTAQNVLVLSDGGPPVDIEHAYAVEAAAHGLRPDLNDPVALDLLGRYLRDMDRVVVSCAPEARPAWAMALKGLAVEGEILDDTVLALGAFGARRRYGHGMLLVSRKPLGIRARALKRGYDLALSAAALIALAPLMAVVALLIKLEDGGPVLFVQRRMGRSNRFFAIYKFRSMHADRLDADGRESASRTDSRVTRIGAFIRRTSIDELPQLFNVLAGTMSLVGPRPHALGSYAGSKLFWEVDARYWQRHTLKPGLTGLAQVRGFRGATDSEGDLSGRLQADLQYLDGWSIWRDIAITVRTSFERRQNSRRLIAHFHAGPFPQRKEVFSSTAI